MKTSTVLTLLLTAALAIGLGVVAIQRETETTLADTISSALSQQVSYDDFTVSWPEKQLNVQGLVLRDNTQQLTNFIAASLTLTVDYTDVLHRHLKVNKIEANRVTLRLDYQAPGQSNYHAIQASLRDYLQSRLHANRSRTEWDVYAVVLNEVTVNIIDYQYGDVGTFYLEQLELPHVSSAYSSRNNRDILRKAMAKAVLTQFRLNQLKGEFNEHALLAFVAREGKAQLLEALHDKTRNWAGEGQHLLNHLQGKE